MSQCQLVVTVELQKNTKTTTCEKNYSIKFANDPELQKYPHIYLVLYQYSLAFKRL